MAGLRAVAGFLVGIPLGSVLTVEVVLLNPPRAF
jgi:hypothetical protein